MTIKAIFSVSPDWALADSKGNLLYPGNNQSDLTWFKAATYGETVVAGRKTAGTLPEGLKYRECLVLSNNPEFNLPGWTTLNPMQLPHDCWVIGGANLVNSLTEANLIDEYWISEFYCPSEAYFGGYDPDEEVSEACFLSNHTRLILKEHCKKLEVFGDYYFEVNRYIRNLHV